jgi:cell division inhibitor SulA
MAELYAKVKPDSLQPPEAPDVPLPKVSTAREPHRIRLQEDLPGLGSLQDRQELHLFIDRVYVGYHNLELVISHAGLAVSVPEDWAPLACQRKSPEGRYQLARSVLQFHTDLLVALTACDHQVGLAYGLGRAVADLSMRPCADNQASLTDDLRSGRVKTIVGWLRELHTVMPAHSAGAVMGSITQWQQWAASPTWNGAPLDWGAHGNDVGRALADQGKRWRLLLTGQVAALDQLSPEDYVQAAGYMVGRIREILQRLLAQYWPWVTVITLVMVAGVVGSLLLLHSPATKGIGVAISVFGWLGVTGRSVSGELQRTVSHVEQSLWDAELDLAAAWANTMLPDADADRQLHEAQAPRSPFSQPASRLVIRRRQPPGHS